MIVNSSHDEKRLEENLKSINIQAADSLMKIFGLERVERFENKLEVLPTNSEDTLFKRFCNETDKE